MNLNRSLSGMLLGGLGTVGLALVLTQAGMAQTTTNPLLDSQFNNPNDLSNVFNNNSGSGQNSMMKMFNQLMLMDGRSPDEINASQEENINSAAEAFRLQQRQQFQQAAPTTQPAPAQ